MQRVAHSLLHALATNFHTPTELANELRVGPGAPSPSSNLSATPIVIAVVVIAGFPSICGGLSVELSPICSALSNSCRSALCTRRCVRVLCCRSCCHHPLFRRKCNHVTENPPLTPGSGGAGQPRGLPPPATGRAGDTPTLPPGSNSNRRIIPSECDKCIQKEKINMSTA